MCLTSRRRPRRPSYSKLLHDVVVKGDWRYAAELLDLTNGIHCDDPGCPRSRHDWKYRIIIECLIKIGADIDFKNKRGKTFLQIASGKGKLEIVKVLLESGANIDSRDDDGNTALHIASKRTGSEIVEALIKFGADIDSKDKHGNTALHIASEQRNIQIVNVLLKYGASTDSKDRHGNTALHIASEQHNIQIVNVLLKYGASTDSKDRHGNTALHYASLCRTWVYSDSMIKIAKMIVTALLDHGSDITIMSEWNYHEGLTEILKRHVVKVKTANLYVKNRNLLISGDDEELNDFRNECEKEVKSMKSEKVDNTNISFYNILTEDVRQLAGYARNEDIVKVFGSDDYKIKFPIYATLINSNFRKGKRRKVLMERCNEISQFRFTTFPNIPLVCTEIIMNYLSDKDLRSIMNACYPICVCTSNTDNK